MRAFNERMAASRRDLAQRIDQATAERHARMNEEFNQQIAAVILPGLEARRDIIERATSAQGEIARRAIADMMARTFSPDVTGIDDYLERLDALHTLNRDARAAAATALRGSYIEAQSAGTHQADTALIASLEETARDFVRTEGRSLSWQAQRRAFVWFVGALVFIALMHAMVTNDMAKELLEDGSTAMPYAGAAMLAAGAAFDRVNRRPEDEDGQDDAITP
ncbi:hypothetical protein ACFVEN_44265 [Streptomyces sp. NPDC057681]|uniref:hypothetical protein n=1 Tax=Streptomyces sp. NPDC057681 TaxID=3346209 RepID=UPI0036736B85